MMKKGPSRREFLAGSLALAAAQKVKASMGGPLDHVPASAVASAGELRYGTLGNSGLKPTRLVFGTATLSDPDVVGQAIDMGINHFDTSRDYQHGNNERLVGVALKGKRDKVILSSKGIDISPPWRPPGTRESVKDALEQLDTSLKELRTDYLDIWYLHHKDEPEQIDEGHLEAARTAKQQGKIRFTGVSTHRVTAIADRMITCKQIDVVMATYNFTMENEVGAAIERLRKTGIGVVAFKAGAGGPRSKTPPMTRPGAMVAAYRWALKNPFVDAVEANIENTDQLQENLAVMSTPFTAEDEKVLSARLEEIGPVQCRMCGQCQGTCQKGLPVEHILRCVMYADGYGQFAMGREQFLRVPESLRQTGCSACSTCTVNCRFGLQIVRQLTRAQGLFA